VVVSDSDERGQFLPRLAQLAPVVTWLRDKGLSSSRIADLLRCFGPTKNHIRQLAARGRTDSGSRFELSAIDPLPRPTDAVRGIVGVRTQSDSDKIDKYNRARLRRIEELELTVESAAAQFWDGVRFGAQLSRFESLLIPIGQPSHPRLIRLKARVRQLLAETLLHAGRTASSIQEGLRAIHLSSIAFHESDQHADLEQLGRTARLISQAYLLRGDSTQTRRFLEVHRQVYERLRKPLRPEYFHQKATLALQTGRDDEAAVPLLNAAMTGLAEIEEYGKPRQRHEVLDIGARQTNFIRHEWFDAKGLLDYMAASYPPGDIHVAINALWALATGFSTDSETVHQAARDIWEAYAGVAEGYGRQVTTYLLLGLTPELPMPLRRDFARLALYQNAFRNL
jgi:hypothetical protein